jgi:superfamily II DNA helicase RecQ
VLGGLVRAGAVRVSAETFEKDGRTIPFQRVWLTSTVEASALTPVDFTVPRLVKSNAGRPKSKRPKGRDARGPRRSAPPVNVGGSPALAARLKAWRLAQAKRAGMPAFRIFGDRTLAAIAAARPRDEDALLELPGLGPALVRRYGKAILGICAESDDDLAPEALSG